MDRLIEGVCLSFVVGDSELDEPVAGGSEGMVDIIPDIFVHAVAVPIPFVAHDQSAVRVVRAVIEEMHGLADCLSLRIGVGDRNGRLVLGQDRYLRPGPLVQSVRTALIVGHPHIDLVHAGRVVGMGRCAIRASDRLAVLVPVEFPSDDLLTRAVVVVRVAGVEGDILAHVSLRFVDRKDRRRESIDHRDRILRLVLQTRVVRDREYDVIVAGNTCRDLHNGILGLQVHFPVPVEIPGVLDDLAVLIR